MCVCEILVDVVKLAVRRNKSSQELWSRLENTEALKFYPKFSEELLLPV